VILERSDKRAEEARNLGYLTVQADATDEGGLKLAGIDRRGRWRPCCRMTRQRLHHLSARSLNRSIEIIARGEVPSTRRSCAMPRRQGRPADPYRR